MREKNESPERFIELLMEVGVKMLSSGGEVKRVEDSLERMGTAFGARMTNAFVITSTINVTLEMDGDNAVTRIRRIHSSGTDFIMLEKMNTLSRHYCRGNMSLDELEEELLQSDGYHYNRALTYLGGCLAAGSFSVFVGGNLIDGLLGALAAVLICFLQEKLEPYCNNKVSFNALAAFITGCAICLAIRWLPPHKAHLGDVVIGAIMVLIPGVATTNSIRDLMVGDTLSGFMRLVEALVWAAALAGGFMVAIYLMGGR